jgi:hypothetical protein
MARKQTGFFLFGPGNVSAKLVIDEKGKLIFFMVFQGQQPTRYKVKLIKTIRPMDKLGQLRLKFLMKMNGAAENSMFRKI